MSTWAVWDDGRYPPEWGDPQGIAWGTYLEAWGIANRSGWIHACEAADRAHGIIRGTEARAAVAARSAPVAAR